MEFTKLDQEEIRVKYENELKELTNKYNTLQKNRKMTKSIAVPSWK